MNIENKKIKSNQDGLELEVSIIKPQDKIKGMVQISHGMAEHKERYYPFMEFLVEQGYVTIIHDHRGHGMSVKKQEDLGYFYEDKAEYIVEDLYQITSYIKNQYPNKPLVLFGHSMGSMVVRKYIQKYDKDIDKLIVCGSPSKNPFVALAISLVKIMKLVKGPYYRSQLIQNLAFGSYLKKIENPISKNAWVCVNEESVKEYDADNLNGFIFTLNGFQNLFTLMKDIYTKQGWQLNHKELPIFFLAGKDDPVIISPKHWQKAQDFLKELGYQKVMGKLYEGMRHEILNEKDKKKVFEDILKWIEMDEGWKK
ncbi:MAG: alpha/beta hydrolase [Clostridia bacterium]|nr:alpha/beta hydrolase [Clostridia bacterium]